MNKHGWTYKKLGEVCMIERGGSPRPIQNFITDDEDGINWIKIGDAVDGSKYITSTKERIKPEGAKKSRFVRAGDFILSNSMSFGKPYILQIDGCIHDGWLVIRDENKTFIKDYLYYYLSSPKLYRTFKMLAVGGVVNNLNSKLVRNVDVMIPSMGEQEAIVAELDEINEAIELLKQQVADLDNLEQSTFYSMFGDPVTNERGWSVKKLGELSEIVRGGSPRPISMFLGGTIPWIKIGDATKGDDIYLSRTKEFIIQEGLSKTRCIPEGSMIFANCGVSLGFARIIKFEGCIHDGWLAFMNIDESTVSKLFLLKSLNHCTHYFRSLAPEGTQPNLNTSIMKAFKQIIPPFALQQEFAAKVEAMESAKVELNAQVAEMQTLLASRMDYYFD